jgi:hypothetical protein
MKATDVQNRPWENQERKDNDITQLRTKQANHVKKRYKIVSQMRMPSTTPKVTGSSGVT